MSDTDILQSEDYQRQNRMQLVHTETAHVITNEDLLRRERQRQTTLSKEDLDQLAAAQMFDEQEAYFIENLKVDEEVKTKEIENEQPIIHEQKHLQENLDDVKMYVMKSISRQDISPSFAAMESDFFEKVQLCVGEMTENSFSTLEAFINTRLERIITYSKFYSQNISTMLTKEECELYIELTNAVRKYRERIDGMIDHASK